MAFLRFAVMMVPILAVPSVARKAFTFQRLDLLLYRGLFGGVAVLLYFLAIEHIPVGIATLLNYSSPIFSVAFAALFLGERGRPAAAPAARRGRSPGMALVALGRRSGDGVPLRGLGGRGDRLVHPLRRRGHRHPRRPPHRGLVGRLRQLHRSSASSPPRRSGSPGSSARRRASGCCSPSSGATSVVAQLLMTYAYRWVTNLQAGVLAQLTVVLSMLLGVVVLGDRLRPLQIMGSVLTLAGVVGVVWLQSTPRAVE